VRAPRTPIEYMGLQLAARADAVRITRALQNWPNENGMSIILTVPKCVLFEPAERIRQLPRQIEPLLGVLEQAIGPILKGSSRMEKG